MKEILKTTKPESQIDLLGTQITSWIYKPPKTHKFLYAALGVIAALIIFTIYYGEQLLPWIKHVPSSLIYIALFLISPLINLLSRMGKDQKWSLYKNGYSVVITGKNGKREEKIGFWKDFSNCTYKDKTVKLMAKNSFRPSVKIPALSNVMEVYSICRERISMNQALELERGPHMPDRKMTIEQKKLTRRERLQSAFAELDKKHNQQ